MLRPLAPLFERERPPRSASEASSAPSDFGRRVSWSPGVIRRHEETERKDGKAKGGKSKGGRAHSGGKGKSGKRKKGKKGGGR